LRAETADKFEVKIGSVFSSFAVGVAVLFAHATISAAGVQAASAKDFALFTNDKSVWKEEVTALKQYLDMMGWTYREITPDDLKRGVLGSGATKSFRALIMPGGLVGATSSAMGEIGNRNIRSFVESGGGYVGFCAGADLAMNKFEVSLEPRDAKLGLHHPADYLDVDYRMTALADGKARAPYEWFDFSKGPTLENVRVMNEASSLKSLALPNFARMMYYGGPTFHFDELPPGYEVWGRVLPSTHGVATLEEIERVSGQKTAAGEAAIVKFDRGQGKAVLFSQHPVFLLEGKLGDVDLQPSLQGTMWRDTGTRGLPMTSIIRDRWNTTNWQLLHSAFQTALQEPVTPMPI
jgi:glutamine amidotransferase-like uncharacterized protein